MIHFVVPGTQDFGIRDFLEGRGAPMAGRVSILDYEEIARARSLPRGTYILSALDQLRPSGRDRLATVWEQLSSSGVRVLNHPRDTLLRFDLLSTLHREGLNRHRAFRAAALPEDMSFPVFRREEHRHTGPLGGLLRTRREVSRRWVLPGCRDTGWRTFWWSSSTIPATRRATFASTPRS